MTEASKRTKKLKQADKPLIVTVTLLSIVGITIFLSALLSLYARDDSLQISSLLFSQLFLGFFLGSIASYFVSRLPLSFLRKMSIVAFIGGLILVWATFIPGVGAEFQGAQRWIIIGGFSFQPAEILKIVYILFLASWLSSVGPEIKTYKKGFLPFVFILGLAAVPMLLQPDTDSLVVMAIAGAVMYFIAGARLRDFVILGLTGLLLLSLLIASRPYIKDRIAIFLDPSQDPLGAGYQVQQSLIAVGSGQWTGRGLGQSVQKFSYLPEPISDSIFAVAAEEFGFVGGVIIISLFLILVVRAFRLTRFIRDHFARFLLVGLALVIFIQAFVNIGSMIGLVPLSGLPLLFVSHGGTALFFTFIAVGLMANMSRYRLRHPVDGGYVSD